jgi:hypothetical protein
VSRVGTIYPTTRSLPRLPRPGGDVLSRERLIGQAPQKRFHSVLLQFSNTKDIYPLVKERRRLAGAALRCPAAAGRATCR